MPNEQLPYQPFLHRIFPNDVQSTISEGWTYGPEEAAVYGGFTNHRAVDFAAPLGTPVMAAASGLALASFEEIAIRYPTDEARTWRGEPIFWGYGLFVAVLHENGLITTYAHLHRLSKSIWEAAYISPIERYNTDVVCPLTYLDIEDFGVRHAAIPVKAGDVIGYSGITGMGMGQTTYSNWKQNVPYDANDEEHVHFAVSVVPGLTSDTTYIDPFGIYGTSKLYPSYADDWSIFPTSLWLA